MKRLYEAEKGESRLYLIIWALVFVLGAGIVLVQGSAGQDAGLPWGGVWRLWIRILPFLVLFLLHNYLAAPLLVHRGQKAAYALATLTLLAVFAAVILLVGHGPGPEMRPEMQGFGGPPPGGNPRPAGGRPGPGPRGLAPLNPEILKIIMAVLMLAANIGVKYQYRAARNAARVQELEAENLQRRLDTLRYQINPHFFMNTLNNIHALVDLDPEKAKESIVELSRLMRHILYDSGSPTIPLGQELEFLRHYVSLMRLRYPEGVDISLQVPEHDGGAQVPPLVFASFAENAFKHGVSYESPSFIRISVDVDGGKVLFRCRNSRQAGAERPDGESGGIGQENARRRLELLYGDRYTLHIGAGADSYEVLLVLPAQVETENPNR